MKYTILGATGQIGSQITQSLLNSGHDVRAVSRNPDSLESVVSKGAESFVSHLDDAEKLTEAFRNVDGAFTLIPPDLSAPNVREFMRQTSHAQIEAIQNSGIKRVAILSSIGAHIPDNDSHISGHYEHEQQLAKLAHVDLHIFRPDYFMENVLFSAGTIQNMNFWSSPLKADLPLNMTATKDIAANVVSALMGTHNPGVKELLGSDSISCAEATTIMAEVLNRPDLKYVESTYEDTKNAIIQYRGASENYTDDLINMYKAYNDGILVPEHSRSPENTTSTRFREFAETSLAFLKA
ncbi:MAG: NAD(P)H-binding protein [Bacteroidetes bacterium]|nr:NAD(P)H-binding protein [Bacteroidota bacterium]